MAQLVLVVWGSDANSGFVYVIINMDLMAIWFQGHLAEVHVHTCISAMASL